LLDKEDEAALKMIKFDAIECSTRCSKMFDLWLTRRPEADWKHLINAIRRIHLDNLASDIERLFVTGKTSEEVATVDQPVLQADQQTVGSSLSFLQASHNGM